MEEDYTYNVFDGNNERWPEVGDRLFVSGLDARLAHDGPERNYRLIRGYKRAGDRLIQNALEDIEHHHNLVYPILFCYRHYIELALKDIIDQHDPLPGKKHDLKELWAQFEKIAERYGNDIADDAAMAVAACIAELDHFDARSFSFRYALSRKGAVVNLLADGIDLVNLHDVMNGVENFFECSDLDFTSKQDAIAEAAALWR